MSDTSTLHCKHEKPPEWNLFLGGVGRYRDKPPHGPLKSVVRSYVVRGKFFPYPISLMEATIEKTRPEYNRYLYHERLLKPHETTRIQTQFTLVTQAQLSLSTPAPIGYLGAMISSQYDIESNKFADYDGNDGSEEILSFRKMIFPTPF
jgi:hypothetical protein